MTSQSAYTIVVRVEQQGKIVNIIKIYKKREKNNFHSTNWAYQNYHQARLLMQIAYFVFSIAYIHVDTNTTL